jgi:peptidyl-prolyl cis-trans isomerase B (cyclophilin B)
MASGSNLKACMTTSKGKINLKLFDGQTPLTVANFVNLANRGFYNNLKFHRVIAEFMIQGGCPKGNGTGGPGYKFKDEFVDELRHDKPGVLSMANSGSGTNGSQFFITHLPTPWLDDHHTVFGEVVSKEDMDVVNAIAQGDRIDSIEIEGDASKLLKAKKDDIKEWNKKLDR